MKISILQMDSTLGDTRKNLKKIREFAQEASANGAELLICPELAITGYGAASDLQDKALVADAQGLAELCAVSQDYSIAVITGYSEKTHNGYANSAVFIADGAIQANYNKCQLWGDYERRYFEAGKPSAVITEYAGLRIGLLICYDVEFPERVRGLAKQGVDLIAVPTATPTGAISTFIANKMIPVRAFENQTFIAYVNHHGSDGKFSYAGLSCIAAPDGQTLVQAPCEGDALLFADIVPREYDTHCEKLPYFKDLVE